MATRYEDLRLGPSEPFEPIEIGRVSPRLAAIQDRARQAIDLSGGAEDPFSQAFGDLLTTPPSAPQGGEGTSWSDYPKALTSGLAQTGAMLAGAGRTMADRFVGEGETAGQQAALDVSQAFGAAESGLSQYGQSWIDRTSPAFQERLAREWATLDPTKSIWRGGARETLGAIAAQATAALPPTLAPLISGGLLMRAGAPVLGRIVLGASEATLSMGATSQALRQEIAQIPDDVLQQESQRYAELRSQLDEGAARDAFGREIEGWTPQLVGALVGTIASVTGRYLEPVFLPEQGLPIAQRFARGAAFEGLAQEGPQNVAQQVAQNYAAQAFDRGRSLTEGVAEQGLQGIGLGGAMGGAAAAIMGRSPQQALPDVDPGTEPSGSPPATPAPESFEQVFGDIGPTTGWRGGDIEGTSSSRQTVDRWATDDEGNVTPTQVTHPSLVLTPSGLDPAIELALNDQQDLFDQPERPEQPTDRIGTDMQQVWTRNEQLDLQGGAMNSQSRDFQLMPGAPTQQPLGLRDQSMRGREVIEPTPAQPMATDTSAPPGFDLSQPMEQPRVTRADMLRQRQSVGAPTDLRAGMVRDPRQLDAFAPEPAPDMVEEIREVPGVPGRRVPVGYRVEVRDEQGNLLQQSRAYEGAATANGIAERMRKRNPDAFIRVVRAYEEQGGTPASTEIVQTPDEPSAEPLADIVAQLEDLADPDSPRLGVYLSRANLQNLDEVPTVGVPLANFDGKGGLLIAKDREAAEQLLALRDEGDMQQVLGLATGAGTGKPAGAGIAVQQRDEQGNVTRESLVATPEEADQLAESWDEPGREGVIISAGQAIKRRTQRINQEQRTRVAGKEASAAREKAREIIDEEVDDTGARQLAHAIVDRANDAATEGVIAGRLINLARQRGNAPEVQAGSRQILTAARLLSPEEFRKRSRGLTEPDDADLPASDMLGMPPVMVSPLRGGARDIPAGTPETRERLRTITEQELAAASDTDVEQLFLAAAEIGSGRRSRNREGAREFSGQDTSQPSVLTREAAKAGSDMLRGGAQLPPRGLAVRIQALEKRIAELSSKGPSKELDRAEEDLRYLSAQLYSADNAEYVTPERRKVPQKGKDDLFPRDPDEAEKQAKGASPLREWGAEPDATIQEEAAGRSFREIVAAHPSPSEKRKYISRIQRRLIAQEHGGGVKTPSITAKAVRRGEDKTPTRTGEFKPGTILKPLPPREMSAAEAETHRARAKAAQEQLAKTTGKLVTLAKRLDTSVIAEGTHRDADGSMPEEAREAVYGRAYLRTLIEYGQLMGRANAQSLAALQEIEKFTKRAEKLLGLTPDKLMSRLSLYMQAESREQAMRAARSDPTVLKPLTDQNTRLATMVVRNKRRAEAVARTARLHEKFAKDARFTSTVLPVLHKLIGYTTNDSGFANVSSERRGLGYIPTFTEMRQVRTALNAFREIDKKEMYTPLRRLLRGLGFKFDEKGDLVLAKNAADYDYMPPPVEVGKASTRIGTELNHNQKVAAQQAKRMKALLDAERTRRAKLTPAQRRRENLSLLRKLERERTERLTRDMTYEQRKAWEAMERRGLPLELDSYYTMTLPEIRPAMQRVGAAFESREPQNLHAILQTIASALPATHPYQPLLERMINLGMLDVEIGWGATQDDSLGTYWDDTRLIAINRGKLEQFRADGRDPADVMLHTILHEAVHAATVGAIKNRPMVRRAFMLIMQQARTAARQQNVPLGLKPGHEFYGIRDNNPLEFVAEAFSNDQFQEMLKQIQVDGRSIWQRVIDAVMRLLGLPEGPRPRNALDLVLSTADAIFTGEHVNPTAGAQVAHALKDDTIRNVVGNVYDRAIQSSRVTRDLETRAREIVAGNREGGNRFLLSALTMEQLGDFYRRAFDGQLEKYTQAFFARNADNSKNMEPADKLSREWTKLEEQLGEEASFKFSQLMTQATLYGIHPDRPLTHESNQHAAAQADKHAELAKMWSELKPGYRELYGKLVDYYDQTLRTEVNLVTLNALRAMLDGPFNYTERDITRLKLNTLEGLEKEFSGQLKDSQMDVIARIARIPEMHQGPYFPLMRSGDYVVRAERLVERREFADRKEGIAWAREQQAKDPTLSVSWRETDEGREYTVYEREVRLAETVTQADADYKQLVQTYGKANVSSPVLKADLFSSGAAIETGSGLNAVLSKLKGNAAAQAAIKDFYLRSLSDRSFRKREIKRTNRKGVDEGRQHRSFRNYARGAAYYISQLRYGWRMAGALSDMNSFVNDVSKGRAQSTISPARLGEVLREIDNRDKMTHTREEVSKWVRRGTTMSQFMMLTSPSYWMINATQPYMVTLPWLASRSSLSEATAALLTAQRLILDPLATQAGKSWLGAKSLVSPSSTDDAFSVLEQVEAHIRKRGGARADDYIRMLDTLKRASIIDFSRESELRDMVSTPSSDLTQRVLDSSRIMSHLTEVNNRIMTALAAYDMYRTKGENHEAATNFAQQAVSLTQFNYSPGNSPRLFQARGPLGSAGPLVFQFMKYPQHIYALMVRSYVEGFRHANPAVRKQGRDALLGLFLTHVAAGGLVGAMIQPAKWAIGLVMMAFGDDDEPYTLGNAISGDSYDRAVRRLTNELFGTDVGEVLSSGLPRLVGADISNRVELGTLYMVDLDPKTSETLIGSAVESFGGPTMNIFASWYRGFQYAQQGQLMKAAEAALPKFGRDILRAFRFSSEGLTDATGKEIIGADKMTPWDLFVQSIGVQPGRTAEKYAQRNAINAQKDYDVQRRSRLMQRFNNAQPADRAELLREIAEFSRRNPAAAISRSQLLRSVQQRRQDEYRIGIYGANLRGREALYAEIGEDFDQE